MKRCVFPQGLHKGHVTEVICNCVLQEEEEERERKREVAPLDPLLAGLLALESDEVCARILHT